MTHSSCISHPARNQNLKIYAWQILACDGDFYAAALLSYIESLHNEKFGVDKHHKHINDISELHKNSRILNENTLIPFKLPEARKALFNLCAERKISASLDRIVENGFLSLYNNPNRKEILDRTKYIQFHPEICNAWIRSNYDNNGSLVNQPCVQLADSADKHSRLSEKEESILPKRSVDSAEIHNRVCEKEESNKKNFALSSEKLQHVDLSDSSEMNSRFGGNEESILPKGFINNKINQSISININQDEFLKNSKQSDFNQLEKNTFTNSSTLEEIINALKAEGLPAEKLQYPDAIPAIQILQEAGATLDLFVKAYGISAKATRGDKFGVRYLVKVVEGLLTKSQNKESKRDFPQLNKHKIEKSQYIKNKESVFSNDLKNAENWAADLL